MATNGIRTRAPLQHHQSIYYVRT